MIIRSAIIIAVSTLILISPSCFSGTLPSDEDGGAVEAVPANAGALDRHVEAEDSESSEDFTPDEDTAEGYLEYNAESFPRQSIARVLIRLLVSLIIIAGLIYGTVFALRYFAKKGTEKPTAERLIQVIDKATLDSKRSVYIVKVIDRLMIIGVGGENVTMLGEIRDESVVESVKSKDFSFHLSNIFSKLQSR